MLPKKQQSVKLKLPGIKRARLMPVLPRERKSEKLKPLWTKRAWLMPVLPRERKSEKLKLPGMQHVRLRPMPLKGMLMESASEAMPGAPLTSCQVISRYLTSITETWTRYARIAGH